MRYLLVCALLALSIGCDKKEPEVEETPTEEVEEVAEVQIPEIDLDKELNEESLPIADDFADEVAETIDDSNLKENLEAIEKELEEAEAEG